MKHQTALCLVRRHLVNVGFCLSPPVSGSYVPGKVPSRVCALGVDILAQQVEVRLENVADGSR